MAEENHRILLDQIDYPSDLRKLEVKDLPEVCRELRRNIIEEVAVNPGHLASSLGVVESPWPYITCSILPTTGSSGT